jgi:hypothetical protein
MIEKRDLDIFDNHFVCVKVPHNSGFPVSFQHFGYLKLRDDCVVLEKLDGSLVTIRYDIILSVEDAVPKRKDKGGKK